MVLSMLRTFETPGLKVEVADSHPAFKWIAPLLEVLKAEFPDSDRSYSFEDEFSDDDLDRLWNAARQYFPELRILAQGEIRQTDLEKRLKIRPTRLRSMHIGLAKICKRIRVPYPIQSNETSQRSARRYWLHPELAPKIIAMYESLRKSAESAETE